MLTCPLAREAIVAERIAHIGDMIMVQHKEEIELAMQQVFGQGAGSDPMSYGMFRSMIQHMVNTAVPEWYHVSYPRAWARYRNHVPHRGFLQTTIFFVWKDYP